MQFITIACTTKSIIELKSLKVGCMKILIPPQAFGENQLVKRDGNGR